MYFDKNLDQMNLNLKLNRLFIFFETRTTNRDSKSLRIIFMIFYNGKF